MRSRHRHRSTRARIAVRRDRQSVADRCPSVVLLARAPRRGQVKTRLASCLGSAQALALHEAFLLDTLCWLRHLRRQGWSVRVEWSQPFRPRGALRRAVRGLSAGVQPPGGLGCRIESALRRALEGGAWCALAIGSDSPHLGPAPLRRACSTLQRCDAVLGPAKDGGYYLIGVRRVRRRWFEGIDWGTERVLRQTLSRLRADAMRVRLLAAVHDLDTAANLRQISRRLVRSATLRRRLRFTRQVLSHLQRAAPAHSRMHR